MMLLDRIRTAFGRRYKSYRRRAISRAVHSILTDTTDKHRLRVYIRKGAWMNAYLKARRDCNFMGAQHSRFFHFRYEHRAATTPPGRAATAGAVPPPSAPADLSPADLARGTMGAEWIETQIARAAFNGNKGA